MMKHRISLGDDLVSKMHGDIFCLFKGSDSVVAYSLFAAVPIVTLVNVYVDLVVFTRIAGTS